MNPIMIFLLDFICKNDGDCSGHGYCHVGVCKCLPNYDYMLDCSLNACKFFLPYMYIHFILSNNSSLTVSKILVTTGSNRDGTHTASEIIDLTIKGGNKCENWPKFPISVSEATGGLIENNVLICGGYDGRYIDECYSLSNKKATFVTYMSVKRTDAASVVVNDDTLWITGGYDYPNTLASSEYIKMTGTRSGPDLPMALEGHTILAINSSCSMVIGGMNRDTFDITSTFYYDNNNDVWTNGPNLNQGRYDHASGMIIDEFTNENFVAVTGGGLGIDSTELLQNNEWIQGNFFGTTYLLSISFHTKLSKIIAFF